MTRKQEAQINSLARKHEIRIMSEMEAIAIQVLGEGDFDALKYGTSMSRTNNDGKHSIYIFPYSHEDETYIAGLHEIGHIVLGHTVMAKGRMSAAEVSAYETAAWIWAIDQIGWDRMTLPMYVRMLTSYMTYAEAEVEEEEEHPYWQLLLGSGKDFVHPPNHTDISPRSLFEGRLVEDLRQLVVMGRPIKPTEGVARAVGYATQAGEHELAFHARELIYQYTSRKRNEKKNTAQG